MRSAGSMFCVPCVTCTTVRPSRSAHQSGQRRRARHRSRELVRRSAACAGRSAAPEVEEGRAARDHELPARTPSGSKVSDEAWQPDGGASAGQRRVSGRANSGTAARSAASRAFVTDVPSRREAHPARRTLGDRHVEREHGDGRPAGSRSRSAKSAAPTDSLVRDDRVPGLARPLGPRGRRPAAGRSR